MLHQKYIRLIFNTCMVINGYRDVVNVRFVKPFSDHGTHVKLDKILNNTEVHPENYHQGKITFARRIVIKPLHRISSKKVTVSSYNPSAARPLFGDQVKLFVKNPFRGDEAYYGNSNDLTGNVEKELILKVLGQ